MRPDLQRELLELEGVAFAAARSICRRYRWAGPTRERRVRTSVELSARAGRQRQPGTTAQSG